jgi:hypothetical protein
VIRKEAWPFYRTISGVHLCWELEELKGPKCTISGVRLCWELEEPEGPKRHVIKDLEKSERKHGLFLTGHVPVSAHVRSSKNLTDLKVSTEALEKRLEVLP